jgi:hypothetical protein
MLLLVDVHPGRSLSAQAPILVEGTGALLCLFTVSWQKFRVKNWGGSLNFRDEGIAAEHHTIRASQGRKPPPVSLDIKKDDRRLKAVCITWVVVC